MIENTYPEAIEESGSYLRMTLQNIARHKVPYNPISYSIWYEYATGRNDQLNQDIDLFISQEKGISFEVVSKLFKKHMADNQIREAERRALEFKNILTEMTKHLGESGNQIDKRGNTLDEYVQKLSQATSTNEISGIAKNIVSETKSMVESGKALKERLQSTVVEIETLKKELEGVKQTAKTDMLTKLLNRHGFDHAMARVLAEAKKSKAPVSVLMLDIDHFKQVNDNYGHLIGDNVLKLLSKLIKDCIKGKDIAARFGGEEFIIVLPDTPLEGAYVLAEQLRFNLKKMRFKIKDSGKPITPITISLGVSLYKDSEPLDETIQRADDALYLAKNTGRDKTVTEIELGKN